MKPRREMTVALLVAGALVMVVLAVWIINMGGGTEEPRPTKPAAETAETIDDEPKPDPARPGITDDVLGRLLFESALAFDKATPDKPDAVMERYRIVRVRFPKSTWASQAAARTSGIRKGLAGASNDAVEKTRREARALAAKGSFRAALELLARDGPEAAAILNLARRRFNEAVVDAQERAKRGDHAEAVAAFAGLSPEMPDELRRAALEQIEALEAAAARLATQKALAGQEAVESGVLAAGPALVEACGRRRFDTALLVLSNTPDSVLKTDEREAIKAASEFWNAALGALRSRAGHDVTLLLADGRRASGRLKVGEKGLTVGPLEVPFDALHDDEIVLLATGALKPDAPDTYARAAMYFFALGKRDLSRVYLATAHELGGLAPALERAWRGGILRAAQKN